LIGGCPLAKPARHREKVTLLHQWVLRKRGLKRNRKRKTGCPSFTLLRIRGWKDLEKGTEARAVARTFEKELCNALAVRWR